MKKESGIMMSKDKNDALEVYVILAERWEEWIIKGRRLKGESEDFNF